MLKLDFEQRQRATALADDMAMTDSIGEFASEIIFLRDQIERLRIHVAECEAVLRQLTNPGWVNDALASGSVERIAGDICALKRQARGVLNSVPNA